MKTKGNRRAVAARLWSSLPFVVIFGALMLIPTIAGAATYQLGQYEYVLSLVIVTVGVNVALGFAGQLSLGPGGVFAVGGFAAVVLANDFPRVVGLPLMILAGIVVGALFGLIVGWPALRISGFYLGMVTLIIALVVPIIASNWSLTGDSSGISLIANAVWNRHLNGEFLYFVILTITLAATIIALSLRSSRVGRRFSAVKASEELASALGIAVRSDKLLAFAISSAIGGCGGAIYAYTQEFMSPGSATADLSIYVLAACVIGGLGSILGPVLGALLVFGLSIYLGGLLQYEGILFGALLLAFVLLAPNGMTGLVAVVKKGRSAGGNGDGAASGLLRMAQAALRSPRTEDGGRRTGARRGGKSSEARQPRAVQGPGGSGGEGEGVALSVQEATRTFGGVLAVDRVTLTIGVGKVHGLVGSNGSGKTTLLNLISGFYALDSGEVRLGSIRLDGAPIHHVARSGLGRTFQTPKLIEDASVLENVMVASEGTIRCSDMAAVLHLPVAAHADQAALRGAMAALELVGIEDMSSQIVGETSHGTRRLVEVARAVAMSPLCLLLDEPAAGLGAFELELLERAVRRVAEQGTAVLLVEHNLPFVLRVASEVTVLHSARVLASGGPEVLRDNPEVAAAFMGSRQVGE